MRLQGSIDAPFFVSRPFTSAPSPFAFKMPERPTKLCQTCGRLIEWRKKWERDWDGVKYCSAACRRGVGETDAALERAITELLAGRDAKSTICPSEAARAVRPDDWRPLMERARRAARRLAAAGKLVFTQSGRVIDPATARGPVRLRRV